MKEEQQKNKGRKKVLKLKADLKVVEEEGDNSDKDWVECNTDEENEQEQLKLEELLDDLKLSDGEQEEQLKEQD